MIMAAEITNFRTIPAIPPQNVISQLAGKPKAKMVGTKQLVLAGSGTTIFAFGLPAITVTGAA